MAKADAVLAAIPNEAMIESLREAQRQRAATTHEEILRLVKKVGVAQIQIGIAIKPMRDDSLFKYLDPPFETWRAYVEKGLELSHSQVLKWIIVGEHFNEDQVRTWGIERLHRLAQLQFKRQEPIPKDLDTFMVKFSDGESRPFAEMTVQQLLEVSMHGRPLDKSGEPSVAGAGISARDAALNASIGGDEKAWAELVRGELHGLDVEIDVKPGKRGPRVHFSVDFDQIRTFMRLLPERGLIVDLPDSVEPHE